MSESEAARRSGMLDVGDGQSIYWEEWGEPDGVPALYLHGGPGGTLGKSRYRHRFDLGRTRVIGFDQRGCGRSLPHASDLACSLAGNTTSALIGDIERLRAYLGIDAWIVNGVSWGSTLALAYACAHPERVRALVLYAVTTTSRSEVDWVTEGVGAVFPEAWDRLAVHAERAGIGYRRGQGRLIDAYRELIESADPSVRDEASKEWAMWEDTHVSIGAGGLRRDPRWEDAAFRHAFVRLVTRYWANDGFCTPPILQMTDRLERIPTSLLHGRRDISSPVITAWRLHRALPASRLYVDEGGGHGGASMLAVWEETNHELVAPR